MMYLGDFADNAIVPLGAFTTNAADGGRESFSASLEEADITIYSDDGDGTWTAMTLDASTIVITENPGSQAGVYLVAVDMSNDADFTTGKDYVAVLYPDETVDSQSVAGVLGHWSCENRGVNVTRISGSGTAADNAETVFDTDFATNYNTTRDAWVTNVQDTVGTGNLPVDVIAVSGDTTAADNLELAYDGTGYDVGGIDVSALNTAATAVGSDGAGLTEAGGTGDQLTSLATAAALSTAQTDLDTITGSDGVTLATAQGNYAPAKAGDNMGTVSAVTGGINTGAGTITTLDALDTAQDSQHSTTQGKVDTAQADLDILTGTDGVTIATAQPNYAPATAAALATAQTDLDTITGSDGVTLATAQGNYAPAVAGNQMDLVNAPNATAVTAIQNGLATSSALTTVGSNVTAIKAITDALTAAAAAKLATSAGTIVTGTVSTATTSPTTTVFAADDITEATADHFNGRIIIFTSGALANQATDITDYALDTGEGKFTVTALTESPSNDDTFVIV